MAALSAVTLTVDAGRDSLSETDYREIYDELRKYQVEEDRYLLTLDAFVAMVRSAYSKAAWSKYHRGELELNRRMRNELRAAVGLPALPLTVAEAMTGVDPNAEVVQVGTETPAQRVILLATAQPLTLSVNGSVLLVEDDGTAAGKGEAAPVTAVTRKRSTVSLSQSAFERINAKRQEKSLSWEQLLDMAVAQLGD